MSAAEAPDSEVDLLEELAEDLQDRLDEVVEHLAEADLLRPGRDVCPD